jgi:hypothetical protein
MELVKLPSLSDELFSRLVFECDNAEAFLDIIGHHGPGLVKHFREDPEAELAFFSKVRCQVCGFGFGLSMVSNREACCMEWPSWLGAFRNLCAKCQCWREVAMRAWCCRSCRLPACSVVPFSASLGHQDAVWVVSTCTSSLRSETPKSSNVFCIILDALWKEITLRLAGSVFIGAVCARSLRLRVAKTFSLRLD